MKLNCKICNKEFDRFGKQAETAKCCSYECMGKYNKASPNTFCDQCNKPIHKKNSDLVKYKNKFCSIACFAKWRSLNSFGENNPNFRNKMYDHDGYRLIHSQTFRREKIHIAVAKEILGLTKIPKGYHVHHRDANHLNNDPENLCLLNLSDHRWVHSQFGSATLWAYMKNKVSLEQLVDWSNDKERTIKILPTNLFNQIGVFKSDELLENPEMKLSEK